MKVTISLWSNIISKNIFLPSNSIFPSHLFYAFESFSLDFSGSFFGFGDFFLLDAFLRASRRDELFHFRCKWFFNWSNFAFLCFILFEVLLRLRGMKCDMNEYLCQCILKTRLVHTIGKVCYKSGASNIHQDKFVKKILNGNFLDLT